MEEKAFENAPVSFGTNLGLILEYYDMYIEDRQSVSSEMRILFDSILDSKDQVNLGTTGSTNNTALKGILKWLVDIRTYGHLVAKVYPLYPPTISNAPTFNFEDYGFTEEDLKSLDVETISTHLTGMFDNALDAVKYLKDVYSAPLSYEYMHMNNQEERAWFEENIEVHGDISYSNEEKKELFKELAKTEGFEKYLQKNFVGAKRFSIEGVDSLVPMLNHLLKLMANNELPNLQIGMAHRGRLNVLTHVLRKPYTMMLSEFMSTDASKFIPEDGSLKNTSGWMGDVKYHLGGKKKFSDYGIEQTITLANNPSHLEIVGPVVLGKARAQQEDVKSENTPVQDTDKSLAVIVHGDAAFPAQGVNPEAMNFSNLAGYTVGGAIHIITNNRIGFTTEEWDARSTLYASDIAKGFDIPILHVNADEPEHVLKAIELAFNYRQTWKKDIVIDLIGYRRMGHNEMDEPMTTNPMLYNEIKNHPTIEHLYGDKLVSEGVISADEKNETIDSVEKTLRSSHDLIDKNDTIISDRIDLPEFTKAPQLNTTEVDITEDRLKKINDALLTYPDSFKVFKRLEKVLERRRLPFENEDGRVDWGHAEALAFATLLEDGVPIRITGEDAERGTFAHRNAVLHDPETGEQYTPLKNLENAKASFDLHNSPLSELAVVAYEYGYNVENNEVLTIWEAQYGDFANMAQPIFDTFMSASNAKWGEQTGLTLLLPNAQEGQGPEHSSARIERFLQLCAENNMTIANVSSSSNYFYLLRRQAENLNTDKMRPLVLASPKSLLRNNTTSRPLSEFVGGKFHEILFDNKAPEKVKTVLVASGKMAIELEEKLASEPDDSFLLIKLEQIYPFPKRNITEVLETLPNLEEIRFVQEEPKNQGAYYFVLPKFLEMKTDKQTFTFVGRQESSSPAEGYAGVYKIIQQNILEEALKK
ncbi:2-oxoglutarate dehydrogenase E1 component [Phocicoccus schoeneichii]|uniref:2-oxoglutarate dehydrogenase E1 component n=1 Tax=Phocicoccus schoeneichii TaxID=1812261 RepID=UPI003D0F5486